jgi:zinc transport system ATP-binding protein
LERIVVDELSVSYGQRSVLERISLQLPQGKLTAIIGPNGAGKSTLLRCLLGEIPYTGSIQFLGQNGPLPHPRLGYVPQRLAFDNQAPISVLDLFVAARGRYPVWLPISAKIRRQVEVSLSTTSSAHLIDQRLGSLSGGELQRVLLALALTPLPHALLLDEPDAGVDQVGLEQFYQALSELRRHRVTIVLISHDLEQLAGVADQVVLLNREVLASGNPMQVFADPRFRQALGEPWRHPSSVPAVQ